MVEYRVCVRGPGGVQAAEVILDCESDAHALGVASTIDSPFGHELRADGRLLGVFEAAWGDGFPPAEDAEA